MVHSCLARSCPLNAAFAAFGPTPCSEQVCMPPCSPGPQAVPLAAKKAAHVGKSSESAAALLQLPHFDDGVLRKLQKRRVKTLPGEGGPGRAKCTGCCMGRAPDLKHHWLRLWRPLHPPAAAARSSTFAATELQLLSAEERAEALQAAGFTAAQVEDVETMLSGGCGGFGTSFGLHWCNAFWLTIAGAQWPLTHSALRPCPPATVLQLCPRCGCRHNARWTWTVRWTTAWCWSATSSPAPCRCAMLAALRMELRKQGLDAYPWQDGDRCMHACHPQPPRLAPVLPHDRSC